MIDCSIKEIQEFAERLLDVSDKEVTQILYVGGSAMALNGLRMQSEDVDVYVDPTVTKVAIEARRVLEASGIQVDVVDSPYIWGSYRINPQKIMDSTESSFEVERDGKKVIGIALPPEYLFTLKSNSGRDKDLNDIEILSKHLTPEVILKAAAEIIELNPLVAQDFIEMILSEMQALYFEPVSLLWIDKLNLDDHDRKRCLSTFGLSI